MTGSGQSTGSRTQPGPRSQVFLARGEPCSDDSLTVPQSGSHADDAAAVLDQLHSGAVTSVVVGGCDLCGMFRAKRTAERLTENDHPVVEFSEYMWVMEIDDYPQPPPSGFRGRWPYWHTGFSDIEAVPDLETLRRVPWLDRAAVALCDYRFPDGSRLRCRSSERPSPLRHFVGEEEALLAATAERGLEARGGQAARRPVA